MRTSVLAVSIFALLGATGASAQELRIGGSTTSLPIISSCSAHFMEKYPTWDKADASLPKQQAVIYVTGGGSGFGVKGLLNGTIDLGMVARELKDSETKELGAPVVKAFARDAVAIATSAKSPWPRRSRISAPPSWPPSSPARRKNCPRSTSACRPNPSCC